MDEELDRFKRLVDLTALAATLGYQLDPRARGVRATVTMKHPGTEDKIVIRRDTDGHWTYFSVHDDRDKGSVLDFLQRRRSLNLGAARKELRAWLREDRVRPPPAVRLETNRQEPAAAAAAVTQAYAAAAATESRYLLGRALRRETMRASRFVDSFRVDRRGNVIFPHRDAAGQIIGFEIKNRGFTSFATGGHKTAWSSACRQDDIRLVIVEGAIDALSYHQVFPDDLTRYLSTAGAVGRQQLAVIARAIGAMPAAAEIIIATDNDAGGERLFEQIADVAGDARMRRHASPVPKDWNDYVQSLERDRPLRREIHIER